MPKINYTSIPEPEEYHQSQHFSRGEKLLNASGVTYAESDIRRNTIANLNTERKYNQKLTKYKERCFSLSGNITQLKDKVEELQKTNSDLKQKLEKREEYYLHELFKNVFSIEVEETLIRSFKRHSKVVAINDKYSDTEIGYWIKVFCSLKQKQFEFISRNYLGPSKSSIQRWLALQNIPSLEDFENIEKLDSILAFWYTLNRKKYPDLIDKSKTKINLSIDATKINEMFKYKDDKYIGIMKEGIELVKVFDYRYKYDPVKYQELLSRLVANNYLYSHCFVFLYCPVKSVKPFPVHIKFTNSGFATSEILDTIEKIQSLKNMHFKIIATSTDADIKYDKFQNDFFYSWIEMFENNYDIRTHAQIMLYPNDGSHILKRIRTHLIKNGVIFLFKNQASQSISRSNFEDLVDDIPSSVWNTNIMSSMDDFYPYQMFRSDILQKAIKQQKWPMVIYLLPSVATNMIIRSKNIYREQAIIIGYTAIFTLLNYLTLLEVKEEQGKKSMNIINRNKKLQVFFENEKKKNKFIGFFDKKHCIHLCNFLYSIVRVLETEENEFKASKIGTICNEYFFGQLKNESQDKLYTSIRSAFMRKIIQRIYKQDEPDKKIDRRWFNTAEYPEGKYSLGKDEIKKCMSVANIFFINCGISLPNKYKFQTVASDHIEEVMVYFDENYKLSNNTSNFSYVARSSGASIQKTYIISGNSKNNILSQPIYPYKQFELACCATSAQLPKAAPSKLLNVTIREINHQVPNCDKIGNVGIRNFSGHICYASCILQILIHVNKFQNLLCKGPQAYALGCIQSFSASYIEGAPNAKAFFNSLHVVDENYKNLFPTNQDQDPLNFYESLVQDFIEYSTRQNKTFLVNLFEGKEKHIKVCKKTHSKSEIQSFYVQYLTKEQSNMLLTIESQSEQIKEKIYCELCKKSIDFTSTLLIEKFPDLLACKLPHGHDMHSFEKQIILNGKNFNLYALLVQTPGHFKCAIYTSEGFIEFNDSKVSKIRNDDEYMKSKNIYAVFYQRGK